LPHLWGINRSLINQAITLRQQNDVNVVAPFMGHQPKPDKSGNYKSFSVMTILNSIRKYFKNYE